MKQMRMFLVVGMVFLMGCIHPPITVQTYSDRDTGTSTREKLISELKKNSAAGQFVPNSVGVLPFREVGTETGLGLAATEFFTSNLGLFDRFNLIDQSYSDVLEEEFANYSPGKKRALLRAEQLVEGTVMVQKGKLRLKGFLYAGNQAQPIPLGELEGNSRDFFRLVADLNIKFLEKNRITVTPDIARELYKIPTEDLVAYILYAKGRRYERLGEYQKATKAYRAAIKRDPGFKQAQKRLNHVEKPIIASPVPDANQPENNELTNISNSQAPNIIQEASVPSVGGNAPVQIEIQLP